MTKWAKVKTNIVTCLECGSYHERGTICGKCYSRVKEETKRLHELMFDKDGRYIKADAYPTKEVRFVYEGEKDAASASKEAEVNLVEVPKKRPSWFDNNLATKVSSTKVNNEN